VNITKRFKVWWTEKYNRDLTTYYISRSRTNWDKYKKMVKLAKKTFFNNKIQEITSSNKKP